MNHFRQVHWLIATIAVTSWFLGVTDASAQQACIRIMVQDSTLNNLVDPPGYKTATLGELGEVKKFGSGQQPMILLPGLGFGAEVFKEFADMFSTEATMYAVTLPGFGGTPAPPAPPESTSFAEQTWTTAAYHAIERLIKEEKLERPIIVGHWLTGSTLALKVALDHPEEIRGVILLAGVPSFVPTDTLQMKLHPPLDRLAMAVDKFMAPLWFKTVTRETWDDNNFLPSDYAINPIRGLRLWRMAAEPSLHTWVRYLCEFYAYDVTFDIPKLTVPTLLLKPGLEGNYFDPGQDYLTGFCHIGWNLAIENGAKMTVKTIPNTRVCMWFDQPELVAKEVREFMATTK